LDADRTRHYPERLFSIGDGQVDIMFRDVSTGAGGMMRTLLGNSVPVDLELYRMEDGIYRDEPATTLRIRRFDPLNGLGNIFFPAVLVGDVNGDARSDVLVGQSPEELHIFLGVAGPDLLARRPQKVAVAVPYDERNTWLVDLNKDGKQDLLMHHAPAKPRRLTVLISRWLTWPSNQITLICTSQRNLPPNQHKRTMRNHES